MAVYFAVTKDANYVKIGFAKEDNVFRRLNKLRTGCPLHIDLVHIVEGADVYDEHKFHREFQMEHVRGEWFRYEPVISSYVRGMKENQGGS